MRIENEISKVEGELAIAKDHLIKLLRLLVSYHEVIDHYWEYDSACLTDDVETYIKTMRGLIESLQSPMKSLIEEIEQKEGRLKNLNGISRLRVEMIKLGDLKKEIEETEGYESADEWVEVRLDIEGCRRQLESLKEDFN